MFKYGKSVVIACAITATGLAPTAANAADAWHTPGSIVYVATSSSAVNIAVGITTITCTGSTLSGTVSSSVSTPPNPWPGFASATLAFTGCNGNVTVTCNVGAVGTDTAPGAYSSGPDTAATAPGHHTDVNLTGVSCALKVNGSSCATMTGSIETDHANPNPSSSIPGFFSLGFPSLTMAGCCPISTGATTLTNPTTGGGIIYNYTSPSTIASQPYLWWGT